VAIPITVRCDCGETHSVNLGDTVECSCGRRYDTSQLPRDRFSQVLAHQAKAKLYVRIGFVFVIGIAAVAFLLWGFWGTAIAAPLAALIWFRFIRMWFMRTFVPSPGELPTLELEATAAPTTPPPTEAAIGRPANDARNA
jgi:hypothetical protein